MRKIFGVLPAAAAMAYPFVLQAFHQVVSPPDVALSAERVAAAAILLALAFALPLSGLRFAYWLTRAPQPSQSDLRACRLAYASIAAPPLFVFLGVARGLLGIKVPEIALWIGFWALAALYACSGRSTPASNPSTKPPGTLRVVHGVSAALIACFVLFHLTNHLFGLVGPDTHAAIMKAGRTIYRSAIIEPVLVILLLFQVASGVRLAWRWSSLQKDAYRIFQIGSGAYLAAYILTHLNSALISARTVHKIDTNWAWASGAPVGLIHDGWSIRLLPHYALGVFFILGHLSSGLRVIMLAHGTRTAVADRVWAAGLATGALIATAIMCALCGVRI
jgi:succinate dehydrogenase/fumarate reductase cytochrome b subunit